MSKDSNKKIIIRLLGYVKPYTGRFVLAMFLMIVLSVMTLALADLVGPVVKFFVSPTATLHVKGPFTFLTTIPKKEIFYYLPLTLIVVEIVKGLSYYGQAYFMGNIGQRIIMDIRNALFEHIQSLPMGYFHDTNTGTLVSRIMNDVSLLQGAVTSAVAGSLRDSFSAAGLIGLAFYRDWKLAALTFLVYPIAGWSVVLVRKKLRKVSVQGQNAAAGLNNKLFESLSSTAILSARSAV